MRQEDLNAMMREPWERVLRHKTVLPVCPKCAEPYCGDGVTLCLECKRISTAGNLARVAHRAADFGEGRAVETFSERGNLGRIRGNTRYKDRRN